MVSNCRKRSGHINFDSVVLSGAGVQGEYSRVLSKMVYLDHRAFLRSIDMLRSSSKRFPNQKVSKSPPALKTMTFVDDHNAKLLSASTEKCRSEIIKASGCKGLYSLRKLPSHDRLYNTLIDPMHLVKKHH